MTAKELFKVSIEIAGYSADDIFETTDISEKLLSIVNTIYADIHYLTKNDEFVPLDNAEQTLNLSTKAINDCAIYGVAYLIQNILGSTSDYTVFENMYNSKKQQLKAKCEIKQIKDTFVKGSDC